MEKETKERARGDWRRKYLRRAAYLAAPPSGQSVKDPEAHMVMLNLVAGVDFRPGDAEWVSASVPARNLVSEMLNTVAHLTGAKPEPGKHPPGHVRTRFEAAVVVETLSTPPDPETAKRKCAGYRLHVICTPLPEVLPPDEDAARRLEDANPDPDPPRAARVNQRQVRAEVRRRERNAALAAPFAYGLRQSFGEAKQLGSYVAKKRQELTKKHTTRGRPKAPGAHGAGAAPGAPIYRQIPDPASLAPYRFAGFETFAGFHFNAVLPFLQTLQEPPATDPNVSFRDEMLDGIIGGDDTGGQHYANRKALLNPGLVLGKERAMVYKLHGAEYPIDLEQRTLSSYIPGAYGVPVAAPVPVPAPAPDPAPVDNAGDGDNAMDIDEVEVEVEVGSLPCDLRTLLHEGTGHPIYDDVAQPTWPFRALTYTLNRNAALSEVFFQLPLPHAIGADLPDGELNAPEPILPMYERPALETATLRAIEDLAKLERAATAETGSGGGGAAGTSARDALLLPEAGTMRITGADDAGAGIPLSEAMERHRAATTPLIQVAPDATEEEIRAAYADRAEQLGFAAIPAELRPVQTRQRRVVVRALGQLAERYRKCEYDEFAVDAHKYIPVPSSDEFFPPEEFREPLDMHVDDGSQLQHAERLLHQIDPSLSEADKQSIAEKVDVFASWVIERNAFIEHRQPAQLSKATLTFRQRKAHTLAVGKALEEEDMDANKLQELEHTLMAKERKEIAGWTLSTLKSFDKLFWTTDRASDAFLEARNFCKANIWPHRAPGRHNQLRHSLAARPYTGFRQFLIDTFVAVDLVSKQNLPFLERAYVCMHDAHRWLPRRSEPALNYIVVGPSGAGKSYVVRRCEFLAPPGVVQNMTTSTTAAFNVDKDMDNTAYVEEEMNTGYLYSNANSNTPGASDRINYFKARTTSFCTVTHYFYFDEETGLRTARKCYSSQHVVMLGATNQHLTGMDQNVARRLIMDYVAELVMATDGGKATDLRRLSMFAQTGEGQHTQRVHRELHCAKMYVESAIKAGALDDVLVDGAEMQLKMILGDAAERGSIPIEKSTRLNWILEAARCLTVLFACYMGLFSPLAHKVFEATAKATDPEQRVERWTPSNFYYLVAPFLVVTKDALVHALEMFDFLYCSRDETRLLATIAGRVCRLTEPRFWHFQKLPTPDPKVYQYDYNYLAYSGPSVHKICEAIANAHKHIALPRASDVEAQIMPYTTERKETAGLVPVFENNDPNKKVTGLRHRRIEEGTMSRPAIIIEHDPSATGNKDARQLCINIEFCERHFDFNIETMSMDVIRAKMEPSTPTHSWQHFGKADLFGVTRNDVDKGWATARRLTMCEDTRAPIVGSIRRALSVATLEKSPFEDDTYMPVPPEVYRLMSFYTPDDLLLNLDPTKPPVRVPMHGVAMLQQLERTEGNMLHRIKNYTRPLPTARVSIFGGTGAEDEKLAGVDTSRGSVVQYYDLDYTMMVIQMDRLGHPGLPVLDGLVVADCLPDPTTPEDITRLYDAVPDLPGDNRPPNPLLPIPFAFAPLTFRIQRTLHKRLEAELKADNKPVPATLDYPACNMVERANDTVMRHMSEEHDRINTGFDNFEQLVGTFSRSRKRPRPADAHGAGAGSGARRVRPRASDPNANASR